MLQKPFRRLFRAALFAVLGYGLTCTSAYAATPVAHSGKPGSAVGELSIPRIHKSDSYPIREGVSPDVLHFGVGHYPGTGVPGEAGNVVLLGHRTSGPAPFYWLDRLKAGDAVELTTPAARYTYRVYESQIITPRDVGVLSPVPMKPHARASKQYLTLVTCHPRGSDERRLVVFSTLTRVDAVG